ncbi:MAG: hypothetical protein JW987_14475 [Anaerolineaceae bacterium]|nr:hypothetical protein [Anaerolineaceae bacterium]
MDPKALAAICSQIYRQYPAVKGANPKVTAQAGGMYQVTFRGKAATADGKSLPVVVRVTADAKGKITKTVGSR